MSQADRIQRLEVDVDVRLAELWAVAWDDARLMAVMADEDLREAFGAFLRSSYGLGYCEALREVTEGRPAELHVANGYRVP